MTRRLGPAVLALALLAGPSVAQEAAAPPVSPILTLDQERLFSETLWGKRAAERIEEASADLTAENRTIEAELTAEEQALTDQRPSMSAEDFRAASEAFDRKVVEIRRTQDAKARAIGQMRDQERQRFFTAAFPVMGEVVRARGAVVVLDSRAIFLAADVIDVTEEMIGRIDETLGPGTDAPLTEPEPAPDTVPAAPNGDPSAPAEE